MRNSCNFLSFLTVHLVVHQSDSFVETPWIFRQPSCTRNAISVYNGTEPNATTCGTYARAGIIWLAPLEACVFIRRRLGAAQFHRITSGNQPSWPELSAKCIPLPRSNPRNPAPETLSVPTLNFLPPSPCSRPSRSNRCFAYGIHECMGETFEFKVCNRVVHTQESRNTSLSTRFLVRESWYPLPVFFPR